MKTAMKFRNRILMVAIAGLSLSMLPGCVLVSFLAQAFEPEVDAVYELKEDGTPTLVIVDDPTGQFSDPAVPGRMASKIGFNLTQNKVKVTMIGQDKLAEYAHTLGDDYLKTPTEKVGRDLGAKQVIAVYIDHVNMNAEGDTFRPQISVRVKVIDIDQRRRVFPPLGQGVQDISADSATGYLVSTKLFYKMKNEGARSDMPAAMLQLAEKSADQVSQLFYSHYQETIGEKLQDKPSTEPPAPGQ